MVGKARIPEKAQTVDMAELEARRKVLAAELAEITRIQDAEKAERKKTVVVELAAKTAQLNDLYEECGRLARSVDIDFYFASGYDCFTTDADSTWNSSRC